MSALEHGTRGGAASALRRSLGRRRLPVPLSSPWQAADYCAIDMETTGLDARRDSIISFGAVPIRHGRIVAAEATYLEFNPSCVVAPESTKVHTLHQRDLEWAPHLEERLDDLRATLEGKILVAHSAWVERRFLWRTLSPLHLLTPMVDTAVLAARALDPSVLPKGHDISLEYASTTLGLPPHTPHHALGDAMTTAQLFVALARRLSDPGRPATVGELLH